MSWSVMVARTRMWRTTVAMTRGGNFCGAAWQRPQLARKRRRDAWCRHRRQARLEQPSLQDPSSASGPRHEPRR